MKHKIEATMRLRIAEFLPQAIETAMLSYQEFSEEQATLPASEALDVAKDDKAKIFKAHHDACKVAIAHIELLIKLAKWADLPDPELSGQEESKMLQTIIENARMEQRGYKYEDD